MVSGNDLDERRLPRTIVTHQSDDFAGNDIQINLTESLDAGEIFLTLLSDSSAWCQGLVAIDVLACLDCCERHLIE